MIAFAASAMSAPKSSEVHGDNRQQANWLILTLTGGAATQEFGPRHYATWGSAPPFVISTLHTRAILAAAQVY